MKDTISIVLATLLIQSATAFTFVVTSEPPLTPELEAQVDQIGLLKARVLNVLDHAASELELKSIHKSFLNEPIGPVLIQILNDETETDRHRARAAFWLGIARVDGAYDALRSIIEAHLPPELTKAQCDLLRSAIIGIGTEGSNPSFDFVCTLMSRQYWKDRNCPPCPEMKYSADQVCRRFQSAALDGLSSSGTRAAIHAFATGENIPTEKLAACAGRLSTTMYRHIGVVSMPDRPDLLPEEILKQYRAIEAEVHEKYGTWDEIHAKLDRERARRLESETK